MEIDKTDPDDVLALQHVLRNGQGTRVYSPRFHFYPLPPRLYVPGSMLRELYVSGRVCSNPEELFSRRGSWRYAIPNPLDDDAPWTFHHQIPERMIGKKISYRPAPDPQFEDTGYVYVVQPNPIRTRVAGRLDEPGHWRFLISWPD